jgi:hypothetical protein
MSDAGSISGGYVLVQLPIILTVKVGYVHNMYSVAQK